MSREWPVIPCASQKLHMEQAGFTFDDTTNQPHRTVQWLGHGLRLELAETHEVATPAAAVTLAVIEALATAERTVRNEMRRALHLPPLL